LLFASDRIYAALIAAGFRMIKRDNAILAGLNWVTQTAIAFNVLVLSFNSSRAADPPIFHHPNVVLIVADDLGYADLGSYGSRDIRTPNLDRLAQQGVRLTDFYAFPVCTPSRAALITGHYPQNFGFDWVIKADEKNRGLPATGASLPACVKKRGYATALFGKWHLGYKPEFGPNAHGFDEFFGFLTPDLDYYAHTDENGDPGLYENTKRIEANGYLTDLIMDRAVAFIKKTKQQPFFLEVAYNAPHWPFQPPDKPEDKRTKETYGLETGTRADYVRMVERMDDGIGKLLSALDATGAGKNTLVIFLSDNGGDRLSDNTPLFHGKYTLWEGGIRVPCILRWPGVLPAKSVSHQPTIVMDLTASILTAAGVELPASSKLDGEDLIPGMSGRQPSRERTFFWRLQRPDEKFGQWAVRRGRWKYIHDREVDLLFDLTDDIAEKRNVAFQHPETVKELRDAFAVWNRQFSATKP
jgi:arylsulfatase A-like enzyme